MGLTCGTALTFEFPLTTSVHFRVERWWKVRMSWELLQFPDCYVSSSRSFRILFHSIVTLASLEFLEFSFTGLLRQYLVHFWDSLSWWCYISISRTFRIIFQWTVTFVSGALQGFFLLDCYVGILRSFKILIQWIVTLLSRALLRSSFNGLLS